MKTSQPTDSIVNPSEADGFDPQQISAFQRDGFAIERGLIEPEIVQQILTITRRDLAEAVDPVELEVDVEYPGSPASKDDDGGMTIRRLKNALARGPVFTDLLGHSKITTRIRQLLGPDVYVPMAHHNCIMTKHPSHSSDTGWHQDVRYWSFEQQNLINVWVALGDEYPENGGLSLIPGTHAHDIQQSQLDDELFLRTDLSENKKWLGAAVSLNLAAGDVLFFHARTFHSASRNHTDKTKYSVVFTFRPADNKPIAGSRSASLPELRLPTGP